MLMVLLVMVMVLGLTMNSYGLDFRGLRLGMKTKEVCEWLNKDAAVPMDCDLTLLPVGDIMDLAGKRLIGEGIDHGNVLIVESRLVRITVSISQDNSESYRKAIHKKYGQPFTSNQIPYQNIFGVKMMGLEEHWKIRNEHIFFTIQPISAGKRETTLIFITDERYQLEIRKPEPRL